MIIKLSIGAVFSVQIVIQFVNINHYRFMCDFCTKLKTLEKNG